MSTSKLQQEVARKLHASFQDIALLENIRPEWLQSSKGERLELDFYAPELRVAVEVQGEQHYRFIPHFHQTYEGFQSQLRRDLEKKDLCAGQCIALFEVVTYEDILPLIEYVRNVLYPPMMTGITQDKWMSMRGEYVKERTHADKVKARLAYKGMASRIAECGGKEIAQSDLMYINLKGTYHALYEAYKDAKARAVIEFASFYMPELRSQVFGQAEPSEIVEKGMAQTVTFSAGVKQPSKQHNPPRKRVSGRNPSEVIRFRRGLKQINEGLFYYSRAKQIDQIDSLIKEFEFLNHIARVTGHKNKVKTMPKRGGLHRITALIQKMKEEMGITEDVFNKMKIKAKDPTHYLYYEI